MVSILLATPALAQRSADEWVEQCRRNYHQNDNRVTHCEVRETRIAARGSLTIDAGQNGGVSVRTHEGRDVVVQARVQAWAGSDERARSTAQQIRVNTGGTISASGPEMGNNSGWAVNYEILVPARTNLDVRTHNGPINVERVSGTMNLRAHNGPLNLSELSGNVTARTQNGPVNVRLAGRRWTGERLDAETVNGPVSVRLPDGYAAHLEVRTVHGPMRVPSGIRVESDHRPGRHGRRTGGTINTDINGGGPTIRAVTTNGPISIQEG
jgi:DUF4097 and DUF4098 domain-containing protein YvlB